MKSAYFPVAAVLVLFHMIFAPPAFCQSDLLKKGIELYRQENYEEAVPVLVKARAENPGSSVAAFFLGIAYKQLPDYINSQKNLRDAVSLQPRIKEALVELIEVSYRVDTKESLDEAKRWLAVAKKENIFPAKVAFLDGLIFQKEGKHAEAVKAFEHAKSLDDSLSQSAEFQIALSYMNLRDLKKARERLQASITYNPASDLAEFAQRYQDALDKRIDMERPVHLTASLMGGYDSNVVLAPLDSGLARDISDQNSFFLNPNLNVSYTPQVKSPWIVNGNLSFSGTFHETDIRDTHDITATNLYGLIGNNRGKYSINGAANYSYIYRRNGSWGSYADFFGAGPLFRASIFQNQVLDIYGGYMGKEFVDAPYIPEEDRDSKGLNAYINWLWAFKQNAFLTLRYDFAHEDTDGSNWDNNGHRISGNASMPLGMDTLRLQFGANAFFQNFTNTSTVFLVKRDDQVYSAYAGLQWSFYDNFSLIGKYTYTRANSNVPIYEYDRHVTTFGLEYRY
jgi:tetratricopeptide (TPR) repeat protein